MLKSSVHRLSRPIRGAGTVEVGQDVAVSPGESSAELAELLQGGGDSGGDGVDDLAHRHPAADPVGVAVGGDRALVDGPGRLDLNVGVTVEQGVKALALLLGERVGTGVQGPAGTGAGRGHR